MAHLTAWFPTDNDAFQAAWNVLMDKLLHVPQVTLPRLDPPVARKDDFLVYTDVDNVQNNLKISNFKFVPKPDDAEILWLAGEFKDFVYLR